MNYFEYHEARLRGTAPDGPVIINGDLLPAADDAMVTRIREGLRDHQGTHLLAAPLPGARLRFLLNSAHPDAIPKGNDERRWALDPYGAGKLRPTMSPALFMQRWGRGLAQCVRDDPHDGDKLPLVIKYDPRIFWQCDAGYPHRHGKSCAGHQFCG